ncbi:AmmeMemoRadiSam system protein A [Romboutsia sp. 1001713B170207_170306_H8]|uniref:AmmeMemoRadiSam system protein A n=1 Tax=Romboutsia sp. 1001713B170207_170306_H8 TaxID=2787112 RepID=UPI002ED510B2
MENILKYYLMPHPPLIIPIIGKGQEKTIQNTIDACNKIGKEIGNLKPETVVIITPHGTMFSDAIAISNEEYIRGDFGQFRDFDTQIEGTIDKEFNEGLINICERENISAAGVDSNLLRRFNRDYELDHGAMIPMYFINKYYKDYKIVHITYAALSDIELYKFGMAIKESAKNLNKKIVFIASGDLSHRLSEEGPYEYSPEGSKFDKALLENLQSGNVLNVFNMDKYAVQCAGECGLRSVFIMLGAMDKEKVNGELLSYEGPFGVGYGVMTFNNELKDDSILESLINMKREKLNKKILSSNPYVKLARESLNHYYSSGTLMAKPSNLLKELSEEKGGVFVSLKKFNNLRGCIGTFLPTTDSIAEEIITNAVQAATQDPRFTRVEEDELIDIDISVDVLERPHKTTKEDLDPKKYGIIVSQGYKR